jgi:hypothetical protein
MPVPVAIPLSQLLGTATTGAALGKPTEETTPTEPTIPFSDVLARQFFGPSSSMLQRTIDTPSGKVFAPDEPTPAKPDILATYPQSKDQPWIISSPMPAGEPKGIMGLPMPETQDKLKGFEKPQDVDTSVLMQNKIKTWEHLTPDINKAEEIAKKNNIPLEELERLAVQDQITFKKKGIDYDIFFDGKLIGELSNATKWSGGDSIRTKHGDAYNISFIDSSLNNEGVDAVNGLNYAKDMSKRMIASSLLDKTYENSLANIFPNIKYDEKGKPIEYLADEEIEKEYLNKLTNALDTKNYSFFDKERNYNFEDSPIRSENFKNIIEKITPRIIDFRKEVAKELTSNPVGSLIDKPLSDETY